MAARPDRPSIAGYPAPGCQKHVPAKIRASTDVLQKASQSGREAGLVERALTIDTPVQHEHASYYQVGKLVSSGTEIPSSLAKIRAVRALERWRASAHSISPG